MKNLLEKGNDLLLRGAVTAQNRIANRRDLERGDIVQTIIIIALILVIVIAVFLALTPAITGQGKNVADCIKTANKAANSCKFK